MMRRSPMKRTSFKSKGFVPIPREECVRVLPRLYRVPAPSAPIFCPIEKEDVLRSESYRRFVASFPCSGCGTAGPSQCAHANEGKGMAMKVCDRRTFPLCPTCHEALDNSRGMSREERRAREASYVDRMQLIARGAGRIEFREGS